MNSNLTQLGALIEQSLSTVPQRAALNSLLTDADNSTGNDRLFTLRLISEEYVSRNSALCMEDRVAAKKILLACYEEVAEQGNAMAMRYTACGYANGDNDLRVTRTETGAYASAFPDIEKAFAWATKAADAGDELSATKIAPSLKAELAARKP